VLVSSATQSTTTSGEAKRGTSVSGKVNVIAAIIKLIKVLPGSPRVAVSFAVTGEAAD